ncbi:MAG: class A beta-lactamase [Ideonella sp.]|nr:class A beta-lactamase [Ideonella sp.]
MNLTRLPRLTRRTTLTLALASTAPAWLQAAAPAPSGKTLPTLPHALAALEQRVGGRLGVAVLDTGSGTLTGHRVDERFGLCSTFKLALAGVVLRLIDQGRLKADQWVPYTQADLQSYAPVAKQHLAQGGMTVQALAEATQTTSDNTAANLLLGLMGGPAGFTQHLRDLGDATTRLDRLEPAMNLVPAGELRDTTTPAAMARTTALMLTGPSLSAASRQRLVEWMVATQTGLKRLRAPLPADWRAGDKTGTAMAPGMVDKYNDVAVFWPPAHTGRSPLVVAAYYDSGKAHGQGIRAVDEAVLAEVGRLVIN